MIINSVAVWWFRATAITICPIILLDPDLDEHALARVLKHEWIHWWQQFLFGILGAMAGVIIWLALSWPPQPATTVVLGLGVIEGWVAGQILWRWLYLVGLPFGLPFWYNAWRRRWETAAYRADGLTENEIKRILSKAPYYLRI